MTATVGSAVAGTGFPEDPEAELMPLADYLGSVLRRLRALPALDLDLTQAHGNILAENVIAPHPYPAFDQVTIDGYAARWEDIAHAAPDRPAQLNVVGDLAASSWRPARLTPGACFSVAAGAPLPVGADVIVPLNLTDEGMASVEVRCPVKRGYGVRRAGDVVAEGSVLAKVGGTVTPAMVGILAACGIGHVIVRPSPRVVIISTGDELVEAGRVSQPGQVVDVNSHALTAATSEAGAHAYRVGICDDDPEALRALLEDQTARADLIITTGGSSSGPGDMVRRILSRRDGSRAGSVNFTDVSLFPCGTLGFGTVGGMSEVPIVCLPGEPGAALIGFEVLARPVIQVLAGAEPVFRPSVRGHLLQTVNSPGGLREFRPALVAERRGGGYTVQPLPGGSRTLAGMAEANALLVLGERVTSAAAGTTVDVLLLDRRR